MNKFALMHRPKSEYAYAYDKETLHILFRTAKNDIDQVDIVFGDPFEWVKNNSKQIVWHHAAKKMYKRYTTQLFDYYFISIKPRNKRVKYAFILHESNAMHMYGTRLISKINDLSTLYKQHDLSNFFNFPYIHEMDLHNTPDWVENTIWYQIFPDRFHRSYQHGLLPWGKLPVKNHEIYGGDLKGIISKLDYIHDLGCNGIYFTPIFKSPTAHKYDTTDYFKIDEQFGTLDDLKALVHKAHQLDIKVMLDGVFNHGGYEHEFFQDILKNQASSIYKDSFYINKFPIENAKDYETFAFASQMPKWRTENKHTESHLLSVIKYWIDTCDIDGWRLDVSNEISHDFLRKIKNIARATKKDIFILGENMDDASPWLQGDQLDSIMNYDLTYPTWSYFEQKMSLTTFKDIIETYLAKTPKHVIKNMFNQVGTHDTPRIKTRLNENIDFVKLINIWMFSTAGTPNIYYGDEIGLSGYQDPDNRRCMIWDKSKQNLDLLSFMKKLIQIRKDYPALKTSDYHFIDVPVLAYTKKDQNHEILIILNTQETKEILLPSTYFSTYKNLFTGEIVKIHDKIQINTGQYLVLLKDGNL